MSNVSTTTPELPLGEYATYRELALNVLHPAISPEGLPAFFAPRPTSGTLTLGGH